MNPVECGTCSTLIRAVYTVYHEPYCTYECFAYAYPSVAKGLKHLPTSPETLRWQEVETE